MELIKECEIFCYKEYMVEYYPGNKGIHIRKSSRTIYFEKGFQNKDEALKKAKQVIKGSEGELGKNFNQRLLMIYKTLDEEELTKTELYHKIKDDFQLITLFDEMINIEIKYGRIKKQSNKKLKMTEKGKWFYEDFAKKIG
ncbi:MAG: hypothetical protein ACOC4M_10175 [Promethearchaeia archaeon]